MTSELFLRRKLTLRSHGRQVILIKNRNESLEHILMKSLLWSIALNDYPDARIEVSVGDRYKPDVVSLYPSTAGEPGLIGTPRFWGEAGQVSEKKYRSLFRRFTHTHFAIGKWNARLDPHIGMIRNAVSGFRRFAPIDLFCFPDDSAERFIDAGGHIRVDLDELVWKRLEPG